MDAHGQSTMRATAVLASADSRPRVHGAPSIAADSRLERLVTMMGDARYFGGVNTYYYWILLVGL